MPKMSIPSKSLQPPDPIPPGIYDVMLTGFKPTLSKQKEGKTQSINLNPQMKIINSTETDAEGKSLNGKPIFENLNMQAGWVIKDLIHSFGQDFVPSPTPDDPDAKGVPGFDIWDTADMKSPQTWPPYNGPLLNEVGRLEIVQVPGATASAKPRSAVKRYFCRVPGCTEQHSENLAKS